uniref:Secreted protein n=1 Tax=Ceratitis capitata TaxID=7213 RepID=W8CC73_CERCA
MRSNLRSVSYLLALLILAVICCVVEIGAAPYQELPPRAGHVPVYIREGNQPLTEIHPGLAEAFHEANALTQKTEDANAEVVKKELTNDSKQSQPDESDIASFDVIKNDYSQRESLAKNEEAKESVNQKKNEKKKDD